MYFQNRQQSSLGFAAFGADVTAPHPTESGTNCTASERRITPIVEPPASELVTVDPAHGRGMQLSRATYAAYRRLKAAAEAAGIPANLLTIVSGYRSVALQRRLWERALARYGSEAEARKWVARPGGSAHNTGRAIDFNLGGRNDSTEVANLRRLPAYRWLVCNALRFGFTPYAAEPWHWEFHPNLGVTPPGPAPTAPPPTAPSGPSSPPRTRRRSAPRTMLAGDYGYYGEDPMSAAAAAGRAVVSAVARAARSVAAAVASGATGAFTPSEEKAFRMTASFEGGIDGVSGNFDNMGLSVGALQWNIGSNSLQPLLTEFIRRDRAAWDTIFGADAQRIIDLLARPRPEQVAFFDSISQPPSKSRLVPAWQARFRQLASHPTFVQIQMAHARGRMNRAYHFLRQYGMATERALAFMFDTVTGHGDGWDGVAGGGNRGGPIRRATIATRITAQETSLGRPLTVNEKLGIIAQVLSETSLPRWRQNVLCRRRLIILGTLPAGSNCGRYDTMNITRTFGITDAAIPVPAAPARRP